MTELPGSDAVLNWSLLWQTTLCLAVGGLTSFVWTRQSARAHRLLLLTLIAALALPGLSLLIRQMNWGLLVDDDLRTVDVVLAPSQPLVIEDDRSLPSTDERLIETTQTRVDAGGLASLPQHTASPTRGSEAHEDAAAPLHWTWILRLGWMGLSGIVLVRLALSCRLGFRLLSTAAPVDDPTIKQGVWFAAEKLGLQRFPSEILGSDLIRCPVIWGWGRSPVLVIPNSLKAESSSVDWESIACHELAHWKRWDQLTTLFAWIFVGLLPWHPLAWWARRRLDELSERACDDWVLACGRSPTAYAETLLNLIPQQRSMFALAAVRSHNNLRARVARLLDGRRHEPTVGLRWTAVFVLATFLLVSGVALAQRRNEIRTQRVQRGPITLRLVVHGVLESSETVELRSQVPGNIRIIKLAQDGQAVREGDLLIELDSQDLEEQVATEVVKLHIAQAKLEHTEAQRAVLEDDGTAASQAKQQELDAALAAAQVAVEVVTESLAKTKERLAKCKIYSPMDGTFLHYHFTGRRVERQTEEGALVRERQIIAQIVDPTHVDAKVTVPATWARALKPGHAAIIKIDAIPDKTFGGQVRHVTETADPAPWWSEGFREHAVLISFDAPAFAQKPGLTVEAELPIVELRDAIRVPVQAIERRDERAYCLVRGPEGLESREISVGLTNNEFAEITDGLKEGEEVVVNPWQVRGKAKGTRRLAGPDDRTAAPAVQERSDGHEPGKSQSSSSLPTLPDAAAWTTGDAQALRMDFRDAPWSQVLQWLAGVLKLNLEVRQMPPGTLTFKSRGTHTLPQAFDTVNAVLLARGYTMIRSGELLLVTDLQSLDRHMVPRMTVEELDNRGEHELGRVLFTVGENKLDALERELKPLLSRFGQLIALPSISSLEALDSVGNLCQVRDVISEAQSDLSAEGRLQVFYLKYAKAGEASQALRTLLKDFSEQQPDAKPSTLMVDERLNAIIVSAPATVMEDVESLLQVLDENAAPIAQ